MRFSFGFSDRAGTKTPTGNPLRNRQKPTVVVLDDAPHGAEVGNRRLGAALRNLTHAVVVIAVHCQRPVVAQGPGRVHPFLDRRDDLRSIPST